MLSNYIKESKEFGSKEDNPMIYTLVISKLTKCAKEELAECEDFKAVLDKVEALMKKVNTNALKSMYSPISMFTLFNTDSAKKAVKEYVLQYYTEFEQQIASNEKSFEKAYKIHSAFKELYDSEEWKNYVKSI